MGNYHIPINNIRQVYEAYDGSIWVAAATAGLLKYNEKNNDFTVYHEYSQYTNTYTYNYTTNIFEDSRGYLWIGSFSGGLYKFDRVNEKFSVYLPDKQDSTSISSEFINDVIEDKNGNLWFATRNGLNVYDPKMINLNKSV